MYCFFTFFIILCSCSLESKDVTETKVIFDSVKFEDNKAKSTNLSSNSYTFSYTVTGSTGTIITADVTVMKDVSDFSITKLDNHNYADYPAEHLEYEMNYLQDRGFLIKNVEDIFTCISKLDAENRQAAKEDDNLESVILDVKYNEDGIPVYINTDWNWSSQYAPIGIFGPRITISGFSYII